jgi:hypothetical protein
MSATVCFVILTGSFFLDGLIAKFISFIRTPRLTAAMTATTQLGRFILLALVLVCVYAVGLIASRNRVRRVATTAALALLTTGLCVLALKLLTARGNDGEFHFFWDWYPRAIMFPSGHAAMVCAVSVVLSWMYRSLRWPLFVRESPFSHPGDRAFLYSAPRRCISGVIFHRREPSAFAEMGIRMEDGENRGLMIENSVTSGQANL